MGERGVATVHVNQARVRALADSLSELPLARDFAGKAVPQVEASDETVFSACLWAASICHNTKGGLAGTIDGAPYNGWDYLLRAFISAGVSEPDLLMPRNVRHITAEQLRDLLTSAAPDAAIGLPDLDRRAEILRGTADVVMSHFDGSVDCLLDGAGHHVEGPGGVYALLEAIPAFQDPLRKKSSAFLMAVHFSGRWSIADSELVEPMIDYHRMRVLLRTGCIELDSEQARADLRDQAVVSNDVEGAIRAASREICKTIVQMSGMPMFDFDVLFWALARSYCRHSPICVSGVAQNPSFDDYLDRPNNGRCALQDWCPGAKNVEYRSFWEPIVRTENY